MFALHICELVALRHVVAMCMRELEALRCAGKFICSSELVALMHCFQHA